jgi:signal transduction histidine kinase
MTAQPLAGTEPLADVSAFRLLEALARIHPWLLVIDAQRRVLWMSEGLRTLPGIEELSPGVDARNFLSQLPRPEQIFPLRSNLRGRSHLDRAPLDLRGADGKSLPVDLDLVRLDSENGDLLVVFASERGEPASDGLDAAVLEALPDAVLAIDAGGFVRRANAAAGRLLATPPEELLARPITSLLAEGAADVAALAEALQGPPRSARCELRLGVPSGDARTIEISIAPLCARGRALTLRDVTVERRDERRVSKMSEELDHCVGALAHDLRSPLVGLLGFSRLLRQDYAEVLDDTGRHFVDRIEQAARTMDTLIHDLLELARIGEPGERPALVDPQEILRQLAAELKPRLEAAGIELLLPGKLASRVYCDRSRLYQVFSNLIGNAIDHMGPVPDGRIEVRIDESNVGHEIVVADNGRGIDRANRERIFEIFQSIGTRADGRRGTGMGLAIVKKIVEKQGGRIWVEGEPGEGARFHVTLPHR